MRNMQSLLESVLLIDTIEGLVCDPQTGTGVPPATLAEWTLQGDGNEDFYDG